MVSYCLTMQYEHSSHLIFLPNLSVISSLHNNFEGTLNLCTKFFIFKYPREGLPWWSSE